MVSKKLCTSPYKEIVEGTVAIKFLTIQSKNKCS